MITKKMLKEDLEDIKDIEHSEDDFALENGDLDVLETIEALLLVYDDEELVPQVCFASTVSDSFEMMEGEVADIAKNSGEFKVFSVEPNDVIMEKTLILGNEASDEELVKSFLNNIFVDADSDEVLDFEVVELKDEDKEQEKEPEVKDEPQAKEQELTESMKSEVLKWWKDVEDANMEMQWGFKIDNGDYSDIEAMHAAMFDMLDELKEVGAFELFNSGKKIYNKYAKYSKYNEEIIEGWGEDGKDFIYYCISDGMNPRNSIIIPDGEGARERAIEIGKSNPRCKYVSMFKNGEEIVIWHADDFDTKGMKVEQIKEAKEGPSELFGYVNGDLKDFDPKAFIEKVKERKTSLHTNRMVKDTDNVKVCHHIVCETLGWGDTPKIFIDVVEETWTRNPGDADDARSYQGEETQERILMESCGRAPEGFDKAVEVLEKYKADTLAKNESLKEKCLDEKPTLGKAREEKAIRWNFTFGFEKLLNLIEEYKRTKDESILKVISDASNMFVTDLNKDIASNKYSKEEKEVVNKLKEKYLEIAHALSDVVKGLESNEVVANVVKNADTITTNANNIKVNESLKEEKLSESKLEKTTFEDTFKATDKKYARYISELEDALCAEELYGVNILEIKNIICHMTYNIYADGVDAEFEFQFDALVDGDFDEDEMKPHWIRFKLFNDGPAFNGYYTEYGPEVESKDEVMMDVSCYKGNQAIIELLQEAGYEPTYNGVETLLLDNVDDPYDTDESLKEAKNDKWEVYWNYDYLPKDAPELFLVIYNDKTNRNKFKVKISLEDAKKLGLDDDGDYGYGDFTSIKDLEDIVGHKLKFEKVKEELEETTHRKNGIYKIVFPKASANGGDLEYIYHGWEECSNVIKDLKKQKEGRPFKVMQKCKDGWCDVEESLEEDKGLSRDQFEKDNIGYKFLELYCEPNETIQYDGDNFSIVIRLPIEEANPTEEEAELFLGDDHLLVNGKQYHVVGVWESEGGSVFDPFEVAQGGGTILDYRKPQSIQASNEGELKEDKDQDKLGLPREVTITLDALGLDSYEDDEELEEAISDWLSDEYGYCHYGFDWEHGDDVDTIEIYNIDWDTSCDDDFTDEEEGNVKYAIILNGEWYATADTYAEASEMQSRLLSAAEDEDDFRHYYGDFPTVEIKEIRDED